MRYFVGFLITLGLIILLIMLLFHGGGKPKVPTTTRTLDSYATSDASVSMTIDGPINADSEHNAVRITVDRDNVTFEQIKGYQGSVVRQQAYPNNEPAYDVFLHALEHANFTKGNKDSSLQDERGICSLGQRYIFELNQDDNRLERFWATNCGGTKTYLGNLGLTTQLFQNQVPDYDTLTQSIDL